MLYRLFTCLITREGHILAYSSKGTVSHGREGVEARAIGGWSHCFHNLHSQIVSSFLFYLSGRVGLPNTIHLDRPSQSFIIICTAVPNIQQRFAFYIKLIKQTHVIIIANLFKSLINSEIIYIRNCFKVRVFMIVYYI